MLKKLLSLFAFLAFFGPTLAATQNRHACDPTIVKGTPWIVVQWTGGGCYYHNTETREDVDVLPKFSL